MNSREVLPLVQEISRRNGAAPLAFLARRAGRSRFEVHRALRRVLGETPKQYGLRLALERAAARLIATDASVLDVALACGFDSHEVFTRAFGRYFGLTPTKYRATRMLHASRAQRQRHLELIQRIGPCVRLFHHRLEREERRTMMTVLSITRKEIAPQHILYVRRRIAPSQTSTTLGEGYGILFPHAAKLGVPVAGWPMCRYISTGPGLWTIDPAVPLAAPGTSEGEIRADVLPGGPVVLGVHGGRYELLQETHAAVQRWIEEKGYEVAGPPWEHYVNDPGDHPNPDDWRTEVYWPLKT